MSRSRCNKKCKGCCCSPTKLRRKHGVERPRDAREDEKAKSQADEILADEPVEDYQEG